MNKYEFSLIFRDAIELTEEVADSLFAAGCDDGTPGTCNGRFVVEFARQANSLEQAISTAIADVRTAGFEVEHVEIEAEAVSQSA